MTITVDFNEMKTLKLYMEIHHKKYFLRNCPSRCGPYEKHEYW